MLSSANLESFGWSPWLGERASSCQQCSRSIWGETASPLNPSSLSSKGCMKGTPVTERKNVDDKIQPWWTPLCTSNFSEIFADFSSFGMVRLHRVFQTHSPYTLWRSSQNRWKVHWKGISIPQCVSKTVRKVLIWLVQEDPEWEPACCLLLKILRDGWVAVFATEGGCFSLKSWSFLTL